MAEPTPIPRIKSEGDANEAGIGNIINPDVSDGPGCTFDDPIELGSDDDEPTRPVKTEPGVQQINDIPTDAPGSRLENAIVVDNDVDQSRLTNPGDTSSSTAMERTSETRTVRENSTEPNTVGANSIDSDVVTPLENLPNPSDNSLHTDPTTSPRPTVDNFGDSILQTPSQLPSGHSEAVHQAADSSQQNGQRGNIMAARLLLRRKIQHMTTLDMPAPPVTPQSIPEVVMEDEDEDRTAAEKFAQAKQDYEAKKATNQLSFDDDVNFMRLEGIEAARLRRLEEDSKWDAPGDDGSESEDDDPSNLFVPDQSKPKSRKRRRRKDDDEEEGTAGEGPSTNPRKTPRNKPMSEMEAIVREMDDMDSQPRKRQKRTQAGNTHTAKPATKGGRPKVSKAKGNRKAVPRKNNHTNIASLITQNVWNDAAGNENAPDAPGFDVKRKDQALKKLIASVPAEFRKSAQLDRSDLLKATKQFTGRGAVKANGAGKWNLRDFKSSLDHHQVIGAGFMRDRETCGDEPCGGICADTMGFGKTVMALAVFTNDKVPKGQPKGTLIVVPSALVSQWYNECYEHIKRKVTIHRQVGEGKLEYLGAEKHLQDFDIVITTYHEVMSSYPKTETPVELQTSEDKQRWWSEHFEENKGPIHRVHWNRIILDEAACIKNYQSRTSLACRALTADKRWALSGTPIMNSCTELYPYFKFLRCPYTGTFKLFKQNYYGEEPEKIQRLILMLNKFMLRRTHSDKLFGAPIVKLPKGDQRIFWVEFNSLERAIYNIVKQRMIQKINAIARKGKIKENYSNVLTMLLRLRQLTGHILLVESTMRDILDKSDHELIRQLAEDEVNCGDERHAQILQLRKFLKVTASQPTQGQQQTPPDTPQQRAQQALIDDADTDKDVGLHHGLTYNFGKYLETLRQGKMWEDLQARSICSSCRSVPVKPFMTSCYHIYCMECLETLQHQAANRGLSKARCLECSIEYSSTIPCDDFKLDSIMSSAEDDEEEFPPVHRWRKKKDEEQLVKSWLNLPGPVLPSAKTMAMKAQILNWIAENPDVKIIIYSQFLSMIRIIEKICDGEHWAYVSYHGQMTHSSRDKAIETFKKPQIRIMIASLKCGGLGLNLTMASRVISIDPWWNLSIEMQAFCRVFRIGQDQETSMTRFVVKQTVDADMIDMQDRKQKEIDRVLESDNQVNKRLTVKDMMRLFGPVEDDEDGQPFIIAEERETLPRFNPDSEDEGDEQ